VIKKRRKAKERKKERKERTQKQFQFLLPFQFRAMQPGAAFTQKLHLIYLINDLLHYWLVQMQIYIYLPVVAYLLKNLCVCVRVCERVERKVRKCNKIRLSVCGRMPTI